MRYSDDTHMTSMKIVQFVRPITTPVHLHPTFSRPPWTLDVNFKWTPLATLPTLFNILWNNNRTVHVTKSRNKTKIRHIQINHDLAHKQFNVMIEVWLHYLTSASIGRFLVNKILFDSAWCLFMAQIKFSIINKIKIGRPEHLLPQSTYVR